MQAKLGSCRAQTSFAPLHPDVGPPVQALQVLTLDLNMMRQYIEDPPQFFSASWGRHRSQEAKELGLDKEVPIREFVASRRASLALASR